MDQHKTNLSSGINFAEESVKLGATCTCPCMHTTCMYVCIRVTVNPKFFVFGSKTFGCNHPSEILILSSENNY